MGEIKTYEIRYSGRVVGLVRARSRIEAEIKAEYLYNDEISRGLMSKGSFHAYEALPLEHLHS